MWIFGYGSIIWKPGFDYRDRRKGYIRGWKRRFWQGSTDHRGTPDAPGRVVTLLPSERDVCWGVAYRIDGAERDRVLRELDYREKDGYERHLVAVRSGDDVIVPEALVYVAGAGNQNYLGPADPRAIATQVHRSHGPSGPNVEYLRRLAEALRHLEVEDSHVFEIESHVMELLAESDA